MYKDYENWHRVKSKINSSDNRPLFKEREIWWCSVGVNVGDEEDGKNLQFTRPVLILTKYNKNIFLGIPMTTKSKDNPYYYPLSVRGKNGSLLLSQIKTFDAKRLEERIERISEKQLNAIKNKILDVSLRFPGSS